MIKLGKYELLERLAVGGMAELFKAQMLGDHGFRKTVVIKKILPQLAANSTFVDMFVDEARITALLDHPNIVQVFEFGREGDELYLVMQMVDGTDLYELMGHTRELETAMPKEHGVYVAHEILDALDYAHNAVDDDGNPLGIVHRDISPGNVLISRRGNVLLTDFGIAWAYERHQKTEAGKLKGKFGYMSPEQVAGDPLDARSDVFATGILLAEMLINRHLFVGQSDLEILLMVRDADLEHLLEHSAEIPAELMAILLKALAPKPEGRFQSAAAFRDALAEWLFSHHKRVTPSDLAIHVDMIEQRSGRRSPDAKGSDVSRKRELEQTDIEMTKPEPRVAVGSGPRQRTSGPMRGRKPDDSTVQLAAHGSRPSHRFNSNVSLLEEPTERGVFSDACTPMTLFHRLARDHASGLLTVENQGIAKEAYFQEGHPRFVGSNMPSERLGERLVRLGVIQRDELERAVEMMPHFGNHLLDAMISLSLLEPLDALRHLSDQVTAKLIDVCHWTGGEYRWYAGRNTPRRARKLQLDMFEILGTAAKSIEVPQIVEWAKRVRRHRVRQNFAGAQLERFGLGDAMMRAQVLLENHETTVTDLAGRVHDPAARLQFVRALYLLVQTGLASLLEPDAAPGS